MATLFYETFIHPEYLSGTSKDVLVLYKHLESRKRLSSNNVKGVIQFKNLNHDWLSIMSMSMSSFDSANNKSTALFMKEVKDLTSDTLPMSM